MSKIVSNAEIALIAGITDNAKLNIFNESMTSLLAEALGIAEFGLHNINKELVSIHSDLDHIRLRSVPFDIESIILATTYAPNTALTGYTFRQDPYDLRKLWIENESSGPAWLREKELLATYTAGYRINGSVEVEDNDELADVTLEITVLGVTTSYTFVAETPTGNQILIGASASDTATNIATKIGAVASGAVVALGLGQEAEIVQTLGEDEEYALTILNSNIPLEMKIAIAYMVAGSIADKSHVEGVSAYKIGTKSVNFRDVSESDFVSTVLDRYLGKFKRINVIA